MAGFGPLDQGFLDQGLESTTGASWIKAALVGQLCQRCGALLDQFAHDGSRASRQEPRNWPKGGGAA